MPQLAVFLGNPGQQYGRSRHNAGWLLADRLPFADSLSWQKKFKGLYAVAPGGIHLLKPQTFMNLSGDSALAVTTFFRIKPEEIIVIHDEIELSPGFLSVKFGGGLGGHNGLRSMKSCLGTADFWRLRIGIGRPDGRIPGSGGNPAVGKEAGIADWVLSDFCPEELDGLRTVLPIAGDLLCRAFAAGPESLLPEWAKRNCNPVPRPEG